MNRSQALTAKASFVFDAAKHTIIIALPAEAARDANGAIHLYRPSDERLDRKLALALNADSVQWINVADLPAGLWKVRVNWSVNGKDYFLDQPVVITHDQS